MPTVPPDETPRRRAVLGAVRHGLPAAIVLVGILMMAFGPESARMEGGAMMIGAGITVWLLGFFVRWSVSEEQDRDREERQRAYFDQHGHWPDEAPRP